MSSLQEMEAAARSLRYLVSWADEWTVERLHRELRRAGCLAGEIPGVVTVLSDTSLVATSSSGLLRLSERGRKVAASMAVTDWGPFVSAILSSSDMRAAFNKVVNVLGRSDDGGLTADLQRVRRVDGKIAAILSWLPRAADGRELVQLEDVLLLGVAFSEPAAKLPHWVERNARVGLRGEMYSLLSERERGAPADVRHVAAESDRYGFDVEVRKAGGIRRIEVKASTGTHVKFFLTRNEMRAARQYEDTYEIQFWPDIDLALTMEVEYGKLCSMGYPIKLRNPVELMESGRLHSEPSEWLVHLNTQNNIDR